MTQPKIDTANGYLKIDCLNLDIMGGQLRVNNPATMAPVVHDRGLMVNFFQLPPQDEEQVLKQQLTGELEFEPKTLKRYNSAYSVGLAPFED